MSALGPDTSRDNEIALALQDSIDQAAAGTAAGGEGTYAVLPPEMGTSPKAAAAAAPIAPASHTTVEVGAPDTAAPRDLAMLRTVARTAIVTYAVWWLYSVLARAWWFLLDFAFVFVPLGWLGVATRNSKYVLWFSYFLGADVLFQLLFIFTYGYEFTGLGMLVCLALAALQLVAAYYVRNYSKAL